MLFFTSDTHFYHARVLDLMPNRASTLSASSVVEMNEAIIQRFNQVVYDTDTIVFCGDFLMGSERDRTLPEILGRLHGKKILIVGNHDSPFQKQTRKDLESLYLMSGFQSIHHGPTILSSIVDGAPDYLLSHFPYFGIDNTDHTDHTGRIRFHDEYPKDTGLPILFGHTHQSNTMQGPNRIHVGVDSNNYYPISLEEVDTFLRSGK